MVAPRAFLKPLTGDLVHQRFGLCLALAASLTGGSSLATAQAPLFRNNLMPQPTTLTLQTGALPITSAFTATLTETRSPRLQRAVERTLWRLSDKTGLQLAHELQSTGAATLSIAVKD